jgi:hypothetical protein
MAEWRATEKDLKDYLEKTGQTVQGDNIVKQAEKVVEGKAIKPSKGSSIMSGDPMAHLAGQKVDAALKAQAIADEREYKRNEKKRKKEMSKGRVHGQFDDEKSAKKTIKNLEKQYERSRFSVYTEKDKEGVTKYVIGQRGLTNEERTGIKAAKKVRTAKDKSRKARHTRMVRERVAEQGKAAKWRAQGVPGYNPPNFTVAKSGYAPLDYKQTQGVKPYSGVSGAPYYKPTDIHPMSDAPYVKPSSGGVMSQASEGSGVMSQSKPYVSIFNNSRPIPFVKSTPVKRTAKRTKKATNTRFSSR